MKIVTVASGKGGVGKTTFTANLGVALAENGLRVTLFDADLGLADLDVVLGVKPEVNVQHAIDGLMSLRDVMVTGPAGVRLVPGSSGIGKMIRLSRKRLESFLTQISDLAKDTDYLVFDSSAGADAKVVTFMRAADEVLLIATPDPASITDAYATIKVLFRSDPNANVRLVVNMVESDAEAKKVFDIVQAITSKFVGKQLTYGGCVRFDTTAIKMVRERKSFVQAMPMSPASCDVRAIANELTSHDRAGSEQTIMGRLQAAFPAPDEISA